MAYFYQIVVQVTAFPQLAEKNLLRFAFLLTLFLLFCCHVLCDLEFVNFDSVEYLSVV
jgi:hypothetical protein